MRTLLIFSLLLGAACGGDDDGVDSNEEARRAYLGLDLSIEKTLDLGMDGFNAADNANIPDQSGVGDEDGTIVVSGQVDSGASDNKGLRLYVDMVAYTDGVVVIDEDDDGEDDLELEITYDTDPADLPYVELSLRNIPQDTGTGTLTGTLLGTYGMSGDLEGTVTLDLAMSGDIEGDGSGGISRVVGSTTVTGTATSDDDGVYDIDLTL
jgi:hypothetical protein